MKKSLITMVILTAMLAPFAANAVGSSFSAQGEYGAVSFYTYDGCSYGYSSFYVADNSNQNKSVKTDSSYVYLYSYGYNWCTGTGQYVDGYSNTTNLNVKKQGKAITASGSLPVSVSVSVFDYATYTSTTDVVNFDVKFTQLSDFVTRNFGTTHDEYPTSPSTTIKVDSHFDQTQSPASFTGIISGNYIDTSSPNASFFMGSSRSHQVSITK